MDFTTEYQEYVENVSAPDYAISYELAQHLVKTLDERKPKRILDLGTGLTSYIFGRWAQENDAEVWSIDDKQDWMDKTQEFVYGHDGAAPTHGWELWERFFNPHLQGRDYGKFDLVCHDMGVIHTRIRTFRPVMFKVAPGGMFVLDDMHFRDYKRASTTLLEQWGFTRESLREQTLDEFGRYACQAIAPDEWPAQKRVAKILVGVPFERSLPYMNKTFRAFWEIARLGFNLIPTQYTRTDVQRNCFGLHLLYQPKFTHVLMLDADHRHPLRTAETLAQYWLQDPGKMVISYMYHRRGEPYEALAWLRDEDTGKLYSPPEWGPGIHKVHALGTGGILIAREAFELLPVPWFKYNYEFAEDWNFPSEDMWFSQLCFENGIEMWLAADVEGVHIGETEITKDTFRQYIAEHEDLIDEDGVMSVFPAYSPRDGDDEDTDN